MSSRIPKIVHQIWIQGVDGMSSTDADKMNSIKALNPDYEYILWDDKKIVSLLADYPDILKIYTDTDKLSGSISNAASKSDIGRLIVLYKYGGVYLDADFECVSSFASIIKPSDILICADSTYNISRYIRIKDVYTPKYCAAFIGTIPNHPIFRTVFKYLPKLKTKLQIGLAFDKIAQSSNYKIRLIPMDKIRTHVSCSNKAAVCSTPTKSSWNTLRSVIVYINCNFLKIITLIIISFIVLFIYWMLNL